MKKICLFFTVLLAGALRVYADNWIDRGPLRSGDKTGRICSRTWEGLRISVPPGKEGNHYFFWFPRKPFLVPADTPFKVGAWVRTEGIAGARDKKMQLGGRAGFSDGSKNVYLWLWSQSTEQWRRFETVGKWPVPLNKCTQNLFIAYNLSGTVLYDDIYFGPFTAEDALDEERGTVGVVKGTPAVDGNPYEEVWRTSSPLTGLRASLSRGNAVAPEQTEFRFLADDANLYLAVKAHSRLLLPALQQLDKFKAEAVKDGVSVLADDSVEIFLKRADGSLLQLGCNAKGFRYTGNSAGESLPLPWRCKTSVRSGLWTAEIAVPWKTLGYDGIPSKPVLFNVCRNAHGQKGLFYSCWAPVELMFKEEAAFGRLVFADRLPCFTLPDIPLTAEPGRFTAEVGVSAAQNWEGKVSLESRSGKDHLRDLKRIQLRAGKEAACSLAAVCRPGASQQLRFVIRDASGRVVFRSPWRRLASPVVQAAVNNIRGAGLKVNGIPVPTGSEFFLKKGKNLLQLGKGEVKGEIRFRSSGETLRPGQGETMNIDVESTSVKCLDVSSGLHLEKGGVQVIPFAVREPAGKTLEIWVPAPLKVFSCPEKTPACVLRDKVIHKGKNYLRHVVNLKAAARARELVVPYLIEAPSGTPENLPPLRFRTCGKDGRELWQELPLRILPELGGAKPARLRLTMYDGWGYGALTGPEAAVMLKTLAKSGITVFCDRKSAYARKSFPWAEAVRAAGLRLNCEIHNRAIAGCLKEIRPLNGKGRPYLSGPVGYVTGEGRELMLRKLREFAAAVRPDEACFDMECSPDVEFDTSEEGLARFARFAGLKKTPGKGEIRKGGALRAKWIDFCCHEVAEYAALLKEGIREGHPACRFMIYSSYQGERNKEAYSADWKLLGKVADIGSCGYGFPSRQVTQATMKDAGNIPFESGILIYQATHAAMANLTNDIIRRFLQGYAGVMFYDVSVVDGFVRRKIADAAGLLARHEDFFVEPEVSGKCAVSGSLLAQDAFLLTKGGKRLFLYLNSTSLERSGTAVVAGKKLQLKVKPYGQFCAPLQ